MHVRRKHQSIMLFVFSRWPFPSTIRERAYWHFAGFSSHYTLFLGLGFCILLDQVLQSSCNNEGVAVTESSAFGL